MPAISTAEILEFLRAIEDGDITLSEKPAEAWAGDITYTASNGWKIEIFNDCHDWDYINSITTDDGRHVDYDDIATMPEVENYSPSDEVSATRYGIGQWNLTMPADDAPEE